MSAIGPLLLVVAQWIATPLGPVEMITSKEAAARVEKCGVGRVTIRSDKLLQSDVLVLRDSGAINDEQLACIDKGASFYDVEISATVMERFRKLRDTRLAAAFREKGRAWLSERKLLDRLPSYPPRGDNEAEFAREVEELCGEAAKGALKAQGGFFVIDTQWIRRRGIGGSDMALECIFNVSWVTGFKLGFIGNEAVAP